MTDRTINFGVYSPRQHVDRHELDAAREIVAGPLGKLATDISDTELAAAYHEGGFSEWPEPVATAVARSLGLLDIQD